jgi:hypothetical protein
VALGLATAWARAAESDCLGMQSKVGGILHLRLNTGRRPIANKYREGKMKSTLKRESKEREIAEWETLGTAEQAARVRARGAGATPRCVSARVAGQRRLLSARWRRGHVVACTCARGSARRAAGVLAAEERSVLSMVVNVGRVCRDLGARRVSVQAGCVACTTRHTRFTRTPRCMLRRADMAGPNDPS